MTEVMPSLEGDAPVRTVCPYCGVGCGVLVSKTPDGQVTVSGDPQHPANRGRLCSKGSALGETLDLEGRLLAPRIAGRDAGWDEALGLVARRFSEAIAEHGPDSVAFYVSGQLLTEDYYVANKLMKGFIGSANIDTNSRLCMASSVAGHRRAFGTDTVPVTYEDLERSDLVVLVGSNLAWCHPVLYQRLAAAKKERPDLTVVTVDPRRTATCDLADLHLPLRPGTDTALFGGLLRWIADCDRIDTGFVSDHVAGFEAALRVTAALTPQQVAETTGLRLVEVERFFDLWTDTDRVITLFSQGVNQSVAGTDTVNSIINCHLATGRLGRLGTGPLSVTGQPNAMGGREVGGLASMLACHLDIEDPRHRQTVQAFWRSPTICTRPGLKAVDLFQACRDGRIKALWIMSTNPAVSMPEADAVRDAMAACPFVVTSDMMANTDTTCLADVLLPAAGWGEKNGTVTNSDRHISRQRAFLPAPEGARPDWQIVCQVAARMGWEEAFDYDGPAAIFREHAALSGVAAAHGLDFDISDRAGMSDASYAAMVPFRWPAPPGHAGPRPFADGRFFTPDRRARMVPVEPRHAVVATTPDWPLQLNTGRVRDHWHTMTRTAKSPRLSQHIAEPFVEIHPKDAAENGIVGADLVLVESPHGRAVLRALVTDRTMPGVVFAPMHWTGETASQGRVDALVPARVDPISGQPGLKGGAVRISRYPANWFGFAVSVNRLRPQCDYWAVARARTGWRAELAGAEPPECWEVFARGLLDLGDGETVSVADRSKGIVRIAVLREGRLAGALFVSPEPVALSRSHLVGLVGSDEPGDVLLAGRPGAARPDPGPIVCSCFDVGVNTILEAIETQSAVTVDRIGTLLRAGTNCGSCRPELQALIESTADKPLQQQVAAE